ncbi:MAG: type II toxin-antitoxin system YafQ family toxin [Candidatus Taylorbacteria bacterium]|nr:type II toxin-antitoxin system YafQ family toxin [Candidatus Taylorbacteria bacterium]
MPKYSLFQTRKYLKSLKKLLHSGRFDRMELDTVIKYLMQGVSLPQKYHDHQLAGDWQDFRECHVESDILLVYEIEENVLTLALINIGSHPYLFG